MGTDIHFHNMNNTEQCWRFCFVHVVVVVVFIFYSLYFVFVIDALSFSTLSGFFVLSLCIYPFGLAHFLIQSHWTLCLLPLDHFFTLIQIQNKVQVYSLNELNSVWCLNNRDEKKTNVRVAKIKATTTLIGLNEMEKKIHTLHSLCSNAYLGSQFSILAVLHIHFLRKILCFPPFFLLLYERGFF